ncbi:MAG: BCD family MFS transporter [Anaerolineae bacterium]|nr:BCD family MFS transporter [Anaerolineae bacterium]
MTSISQHTQVIKPFNNWRLLRLSSFQIGSAMGDILVTSIWNRVMISNFGIPATPVGLLIALRYLLSPLSLWAGYRSDTRWLFGYRRTSYIWLGRGLMVLSLPLLGFSLMRLDGATTDTVGWLMALASSLMYGIGTLISGSPFLALVRDSAPPEKQGLAISAAETMLIIFFAIVGIGFSLWMEVYSPQVFWEMVIATMVIGGFFWFFAIVGTEKRVKKRDQPVESKTEKESQPQFVDILKKIWADPRTRLFFFFLALATMSAWAQDAILEPFGAETFDLPVSRTTRFNSYWQAATVVTLLLSTYLWRKRPPERQATIANWGLGSMALGLFLLGLAALLGQVHLIELSLLIFGGGFGVYTFGGLSLMAVMASDAEAGAYLGLWSIAILVSKGVGTFLGGVTRDILLLGMGLPPGTTYAVIFGLEALGLVGAILILLRIDVVGFAKDVGRVVDRTDVQMALSD